MKTIAVMTMVFLPATFFAAFFSLPLLQWDEPKVVHDKFWIYWAFTIPSTATVFAVWVAANRINKSWKFLDFNSAKGNL
jgi:hypothetical protein